MISKQIWKFLTIVNYGFDRLIASSLTSIRYSLKYQRAINEVKINSIMSQHVPDFILFNVSRKSNIDSYSAFSSLKNNFHIAMLLILCLRSYALYLLALLNKKLCNTGYVIPVNHLLKNTAWNANNWYNYNRTVTRGFKRGYITINVGPTVKYQSILTESKVFNEEHFFFSAQTQKGSPWERCCLRVIICILHQEILNKAYRHLR